MNWYYMDGDRRGGPFDEAEIEKLVGEGTVSANTPVWRDGMRDWAEAGKTELSAGIARRRGSVPPPFTGRSDGGAASCQPQPAKKNPGLPAGFAVVLIVFGVILILCGVIPAGGPMVAIGVWSLVSRKFGD